MTRKERLMNSVRGLPVDRPPACFYEINGLDQDESNPDSYNIFNAPSWKPLLELTRERSDRIVMRGAACDETLPDPMKALCSERVFIRDGSRFTETSVKAGGRTLKSLRRRDPEIDTVWTIEHLLKDADDAELYLSLPESPSGGAVPNLRRALDAEEKLGDSGIVMLDTADPLCIVADLLGMELMTIMALTEKDIFHRLLERASRRLLPRVEAFAKAMPGRLWRICGPEYASPPYMPPALFDEYVVRYDKPMVEAIQRHGGFARIHCHGRIKLILDMIVSTGCVAIDPIEPPPQGDVLLEYVRKNYGGQLTLFGNLEASDLENLAPDRFAEKIRTALKEGTDGEGRGFVLMPSACPYGRLITESTLKNYQSMVELAENWGG